MRRSKGLIGVREGFYFFLWQRKFSLSEAEWSGFSATDGWRAQHTLKGFGMILLTTVLQLFLCRQRSPTLGSDNQSTLNTLYISTWLTKRERGRAKHCEMGVSSTKMPSKKLSTRRGVFIWLSNYRKASHLLILVSSFMENSSNLALQTG